MTTPVKITASYLSTDEEVLAFALAKGYHTKVWAPNMVEFETIIDHEIVKAYRQEGTKEIDNPESAITFVTNHFQTLFAHEICFLTFQKIQQSQQEAALASQLLQQETLLKTKAAVEVVAVEVTK
jgi:hypothetical protein